MRSILSLSFLAASIFLAVGCAQETGSGDDGADESDVIGVTDFALVEKELSLVKDAPAANGKYHRSEATIEKGGCWKRTVGVAPNDYQLRRYTNGTAFFHALGNAPATGDERPVLCLDLDVDQFGTSVPSYIDRFELDAMLRYHLGREQAGQGAAGTAYTAFDRGAFASRTEDAPAGTKDTLEAPLFRSGAFLSIYAGGMPGTKGSVEVSPTIAKAVYRFAWKNAQKNDVFTVKGDPVGNFVSADEAKGVAHVRYQHLDAHLVTNGPQQILYITSKNTDTDLANHAIVTCKTQVGNRNGADPFVCTGL